VKNFYGVDVCRQEWKKHGGKDLADSGFLMVFMSLFLEMESAYNSPFRFLFPFVAQKIPG